MPVLEGYWQLARGTPTYELGSSQWRDLLPYRCHHRPGLFLFESWYFLCHSISESIRVRTSHRLVVSWSICTRLFHRVNSATRSSTASSFVPMFVSTSAIQNKGPFSEICSNLAICTWRPTERLSLMKVSDHMRCCSYSGRALYCKSRLWSLCCYKHWTLPWVHADFKNTTQSSFGHPSAMSQISHSVVVIC